MVVLTPFDLARYQVFRRNVKEAVRSIVNPALNGDIITADNTEFSGVTHTTVLPVDNGGFGADMNTDATTGHQNVGLEIGVDVAAFTHTHTPTVSTETTDHTITATLSRVLVDATSGPVTVTLPDVADGVEHTVKKIDASANAVTIDGDGADVEFDSTAVITSQGDSITVFSDLTQWWIE